MIHGRFYKFGIIGQDTGFEIVVSGAFHADAGAGEIGQDTQEGTVFDVEIFDIGRAYPKGALDRGDLGQDLLEMGF